MGWQSYMTALISIGHKENEVVSLNNFFGIERLGSTISREIVAGLTTFVTMAYIIIVNPKILEAAGIPFGPSMMATILSAFLARCSWGSTPNGLLP